MVVSFFAERMGYQSCAVEYYEFRAVVVLSHEIQLGFPVGAYFVEHGGDGGRRQGKFRPQSAVIRIGIDQFHSLERRRRDKTDLGHLEYLIGKLRRKGLVQIGKNVISQRFQKEGGSVFQRGCDLAADCLSLLAGRDEAFGPDGPKGAGGHFLPPAVNRSVFIRSQIIAAPYHLDFLAFATMLLDPVRICFSSSHVLYLYRYYIIRLGILQKKNMNRAKNTKNSSLRQESCNCSTLICSAQYLRIKSLGSNISCPIEKYLEYVVNDRFNKKYGANGFNLSLYIDGSYKVKCEHLFNEMQGLVKQYDSYYRLNTVSKELLNRLTFSSYSAIKSKISGKYYSVNSKGSIVRVLKLLFDYQSVLRYNKRHQNDRLSFAQMIISFDIKRNDYMSEYASNKIDYLIDNEVLIEENSVLKFKNLETVLLLNELYKYGFVVYPYLAENYKKMMNLFLKKEWVQMENTMLSSLESDYFEYYLSDKKYSGNPALRNKYGHGSPITDESETHKDYCVGLKLFTLLIMKVEEEFKILSNRGDKQV